ncbi:Ribophorin I [Neoconidiobolus thromboides FSU 785]|nr:Ribophorin I [Neoconidiobolus thromboides FSU 785]
MKVHYGLLLLFSLGISKSEGKVNTNDFKNINLARTIDITEPLKIKDFTSIVILNQQTINAKKYFFSVSSKLNSTLSSINVQTKAEKLPLSVSLGKYDPKRDLQFYSINFDPPLRSESKIVLNIKMEMINNLEAYPKSSAQRDRQLLRLQDNLYFSSPYLSDNQKITVKLPNSNVLSESIEPKDYEKKDKLMTFGPYKNLTYFPYSKLNLHFHYKIPYVYATSIHRDVEISHWANTLAVEEHYNVGNYGPSIKGENSNLVHRMLDRLSHNERYVTKFDFVLPKGVKDPYYRDEIGNVSTSNFYAGSKDSKLTLLPRYPIYGGWSYTWYHGYNLPLSSYLSYNSENTKQFTLKVPFVKSVKDLNALDVTLRVILPEGANNVNIKTIPFEFYEVEFGKHYSYFDSIGRNTVIIKRKNVVSKQWKDIEIEYDYEPINLLRKPFVLFIAFLSLFLIISIVGRINLKLDSSPTGKLSIKDKKDK